jgi:hypothetical protein
MKKLISVRLEEEDYVKLLAVAKPFGGVGKWISTMLNAGPVREISTISGTSIIKTKKEAVEVVKDLPKNRVTHSPTCTCMMCKPPKG